MAFELDPLDDIFAEDTAKNGKRNSVCLICLLLLCFLSC